MKEWLSKTFTTKEQHVHQNKMNFDSNLSHTDESPNLNGYPDLQTHLILDQNDK